ncbi:hypothetical protein ONS95_005025 [Cadophora gregata]|uniref:uncharacterized protein n=1 Tax=Cadophora gregata TaxID=51156 RepID=UPI0026DAE00A|nr:uncharacterized protein ONS95_005025 [Cadophora gregata]KAK0104755.1 hypothetical protein ONS95_005025 [Cadophora gregata]KAK0115164.1 hypothetical protein ONS96_013630 [Cadophora gregata f. sp. sojae]
MAVNMRKRVKAASQGLNSFWRAKQFLMIILPAQYHLQRFQFGTVSFSVLQADRSCLLPGITIPDAFPDRTSQMQHLSSQSPPIERFCVSMRRHECRQVHGRKQRSHE